MAGKEQWDNVCRQVNTCALTGAAAFFAGIPDAAVVANGPLWCYFYARRHLEKQCYSIGNRFFCTQPDNNAVVYGTEECLLEQLQSVRQSSCPSVLLIENSCAVSLIGDDIAGIAAQADMPCPVVCIDSSGLTGGFWDGYRAAAKAYFEVMPLTPRKMVKKPQTVNLLGCTIGYYNSMSDLKELKRMLTLAGYLVLASPGAGSTTTEIAAMAEAELNLVVHEELGLDMAQYLQKQYGIPYLSLLPPYGIKGSLHWLKNLGQTMWMEEQRLQVIQREANSLSKELHTNIRAVERLWGELRFERTLVAGPSSVAIGMAKALHLEWADTGPVTVVMHDGMPSHTVSDSMDILDGEKDSMKIEHRLKELAAGLLLGSAHEKAILQQQAVPDVIYQNIALPVYDEVILSDRPFMGLRGACHMNEGLWNQYLSLCQRLR